jgi:endonuclease-3
VTKPRLRSDGRRSTPSERGRARRILNRLVARYPSIGTALAYRSPWQLLVSTVISAQTTDENVNRVTPGLFSRFATPDDLAAADPEEVESLIYSTGFYRQKTKSIMHLSRDLVERFDGVVPTNIDELVKLRGVGRKTASVVLAEAFDQPAIAVDTHVRRLSNRLGLTESQDPDKIEIDLKALFPPASWGGLSMRLIQYGRDICTARSPRCSSCELIDLCPYPDKTVPLR